MSAKQSRERIEFSRPPHLPGCHVLLVDNAEPRIWRAYHETYTVCVLLELKSGPTQWVYRGQPYSTNAGGSMLMEPGETHSNVKLAPCATFRVLLISPAIVERAVAELGGRTTGINLKSAESYDPNLFAAFRDLHFSIENNASSLEQHTRFADCLQLWGQRSIESPVSRAPAVHSAAVRKAKEHLRESFRRNVSLDELAIVVGVSRFHLLRSFKREVGIPPHAFQTQLRLSAARILLRNGSSIAEAAAGAGFSDQSHFARHFKEFWGITPKAYADAVRPCSVIMPEISGRAKIASRAARKNKQ